MEGEGDCDGDQDCRGGLVCGDNNCRQFGDHFHPKDDCCQVPTYLDTPKLEPKPGYKCAGRNYDGRRCCTPEAPCEYGEGDCDGPGDGGCMTATPGAGASSCAAPTTARSSDTSTTPR